MAPKAIVDVSGYVIRLTPFKESDMMVEALTPQGFVSFLARGVAKPTSKNRAACQLLTRSRFSLELKGSVYALYEGEALEAPLGKEDLAHYGVYAFLTEVTAKTAVAEEGAALYPYLEAALKAIATGFDPLSAALLYFAHLLQEEGYGLVVDGCVRCGKTTDIVGLSYEQGGLLCRSHLGEEKNRATPRKLNIVRYAFRSGPADFPRVAFLPEESKGLLLELSHYLNDLTGVTLKSLPLLEKA